MPSSTLLVACLFLPFLKLCGKPTLAVEWPMFATPYLVAGFVFAAALASRRTMDGLSLALRIIIWLTIGGWGVMLLPNITQLGELGWGQVGLLAAIGLAVATLREGDPERVIARTGAVAGAASILWFAAVSSSKDGLWGADVSMVAAIGMTLGCAWWWVETRSR